MSKLQFFHIHQRCTSSMGAFVHRSLFPKLFRFCFPLIHDSDLNLIEVAEIPSPLTEEDFTALQQAVYSLSDSHNYGIDCILTLYINTLQFVYQKLS